MKYCLKCLEPLDSSTTVQWHQGCSQKMFGTKTPPELEINEDILESLAYEAVRKGVNVTGVQKKLSLNLDNTERNSRLTLVDYPTGYILKVASLEYEQLPEFESLAMNLAQQADLDVVEHGLLKVKDGSLAYITKRIDRLFSKNGVEKLYMEDFCQLSERITEDKYKGSYEQCGNVVKQYSTQRMLDLSTLFYVILFSYVIGNSDMHLKNFSLYSPSAERIILSPAYDLLPVSLLIEDSEQTALTLLGKKSNIKSSDFIKLASNFGLDSKVAPRMIDKLASLEDTFIEYTKRSFLNSENKKRMSALISERVKKLTD